MKKLKNEIVNLYNKLKFKYYFWLFKKSPLDSIKILEEIVKFTVDDPDKAKVMAIRNRGGFWAYDKESKCHGFQTVDKKDMSKGKFIVHQKELEEYFELNARKNCDMSIDAVRSKSKCSK